MRKNLTIKIVLVVFLIVIAFLLVQHENEIIEKCGDGKINQTTEECDLNDFGGKTCADFGYDETKKMKCDSDCKIATNTCATDVYESEKTKAILYSGHYIPIDRVEIFLHDECENCCDAEHWHIINGTYTAPDGTVIKDVYKGCGLGKVSDLPVVEVIDIN